MKLTATQLRRMIISEVNRIPQDDDEIGSYEAHVNDPDIAKLFSNASDALTDLSEALGSIKSRVTKSLASQVETLEDDLWTLSEKYNELNGADE